MKKILYKIHHKSKLRCRVLIVIIITMLSLVGIKAYNLKMFYETSIKQEQKIEESMKQTTKDLLKVLIKDAQNMAYFYNKTESNRLQSSLKENYSEEEIYNALIKGEPNQEMSALIEDILSTTENANAKSLGDTITFVGNKDNIFSVITNVENHKFKDMKSNNGRQIPWETFFKSLTNPKVTADAFDAVYDSKNTNPVIMRTDGVYKDNKFYSVDDLVNIYMEEGIEGLKGFGILTLSVITDNGDLFGNRDQEFMQTNTDVHKIYIYQHADLYAFMNQHDSVIKNLTTESENYIENIVSERNHSVLDTVLFNVAVVGSIIALIFIYKDISEDDQEIESLLSIKKEEN